MVLEEAEHIFAEVGSTAKASLALVSIPHQEGLGSGSAPNSSQHRTAVSYGLRTFSSHLYSAPVSISIQELSKLLKWSYRIHFLPLLSMTLTQADP